MRLCAAKALIPALLSLVLLVPSSSAQNKPNDSAARPNLGSQKYGHVDFQNSGAKAAQADFLAGMALLHDFEYGLAAEAFRRAQKQDPAFAMAYWGEAMTFNHPIWMEQDLAAARAALAKFGATPAGRLTKIKTQREKAYFDAAEILYGEGTKEARDLLYEKAMEELHSKYPDDVDAAAFYALSILGTAHAGRDIPTYMRAAAVLESAWVGHQEHPGVVHYLIHCYDDPAHAPLGLRAARIYARIAPDAGHAQHMTSHIFLALGMWPELIKANIAAIAVVNRARAAAGRGPAGCGHYPTWLNYGYLQLGDLEKAGKAVAACRDELEKMAITRGPSTSMDPDSSVAASYANMRLRYVIDAGSSSGNLPAWDLPHSAGAGTRLDHSFAEFISRIDRKDQAGATQAFSKLEAAAQHVVAIEAKADNPDKTYQVRPDIVRLEAGGMLAELNGDLEESERQIKKAVELEDSLPIAFGPPTIDKPTHELYGEFLLRRGRKAEAHREFQKAASRTPGRRIAVKGLAASGD